MPIPEGRQLLPFMSISGRSLLPIYTALETEFSSAGALRTGQATAHATTHADYSPPSPPPSPGAPAHPCQRRLPRDYHASFSTASRSMAASCAAASRAFQPRPPRARSDAESFARLLLPFYAGSARPCTFTILVFKGLTL